MQPQQPATESAHAALQRPPSAALTPPTLQPGTVFDSPWTVAAVLATFVLINLPLQHRLWTLFGSYKPPGTALPVGLFGAASIPRGGAIVIVAASSGRGLEPEDLARNDADLHAPVLYARSGTSMADLHRSFPDRSIWIYKRNPQEASAHLEIVLSGLPSRPGELR
jgi:hypothetical protein